MSLTITYFVHGTTTDNEKDISSGWYDVGLSELGIKQSLELPKLIGNAKFDVVFCSDLKRAIESANLSFAGLFPIIIDSRLRECNYGNYNAQSSDIVEPLQEKMITESFPNGESYENVKERMYEFLLEVSKKYDGKHIAIIAHKAPQLALDVIVKGNTWEEAFQNDWRKSKSWKPGWTYIFK